MANKQSNLGPRRKRMRRASRLQSAKHWLTTYSGKDVLKGYKKWFGVDLRCAIIELKILGIKLDELYVERLLKNLENNALSKQKQKLKAQEKQNEFTDEPYDFDEEYCYIAGYTSGGCPYGVRWDEISESEREYFRNDF